MKLADFEIVSCFSVENPLKGHYYGDKGNKENVSPSDMHGPRASLTQDKVCFIAGFGRVQVSPQVKYAPRLMETYTYGKISHLMALLSFLAI